MRKKRLIVETVLGILIILGGLLTYGVGIHDFLPVPRPDLIVAGTTLLGTLLVVSGVCDIFAKKTKEMEIEEKDERNITIANAAMASAFKIMCPVLAIAILALIFTGYMNEVSCFTIIGVFAIGQIVFLYRLWYLNKKM